MKKMPSQMHYMMKQWKQARDADKTNEEVRTKLDKKENNDPSNLVPPCHGMIESILVLDSKKIC